MRSLASVSATSSTTMMRWGPSASQVPRQRVRTSGSSWYDGTTIVHVVRKSFTTGRAVTEISLRTSQNPHEMMPRMPNGRTQA